MSKVANPDGFKERQPTRFVNKAFAAERAIRLRVDTQQDMDLLCDTYNLPINRSLSRSMHVLLQTLMLSYDHAEIRIPFSFLPQSIQKIPTLFKYALHNGELKRFEVDVSKQKDTLLIRCAIKLVPHAFIKRIKQHLTNNSYMDIPFSQVAESYKDQPYVLVCRLRNAGYDTRILRMGNLWRIKLKIPHQPKPKR